MKLYIEIFFAFVRVGTFGFGGGQAAIPLIEKEFVDTLGLISIEELVDFIAMGNTLPGPISTKLSVLIGFKVAGVVGAFVGLLGLILPSSILAVVLIDFYMKFKNEKWMMGMIRGVRPVVVVLIAQVVLSMGKKAYPNVLSILISIIAIVLVGFLDVHPIFLIVGSLIIGGLFMG